MWFFLCCVSIKFVTEKRSFSCITNVMPELCRIPRSSHWTVIGPTSSSTPRHRSAYWCGAITLVKLTGFWGSNVPRHGTDLQVWVRPRCPSGKLWTVWYKRYSVETPQSGKCCKLLLLKFQTHRVIFLSFFLKYRKVVVESIQLLVCFAVSVFAVLLCDKRLVIKSSSRQFLSPQGQLSVSFYCPQLWNDQKWPVASSGLPKTDVIVDGTGNLSWHKPVFCSYPGNIWLLTCIIEARATSKDKPCWDQC